MALSETDKAQIARARELLTQRSFAVRLTELVGRPVERSLRLLPRPVAETIHDVTRRALERTARIGLRTLRDGSTRVSRDRMHRWLTAATGGAGGAFGLPGLAVELPVTTAVMFRSVGDIARSEGHDPSDPRVLLECLEVFALGGPGSADDATETGYYAVRAALSQAVADATRHVAAHGVGRRGGPALIRLIEAVAARFGIAVQERVLLSALPVLGAVSGAWINTVFMEHYQGLARGHFILRRLERTHGREAVEQEFRRGAADAASGSDRIARP
jgi:hypothetical protein